MQRMLPLMLKDTATFHFYRIKLAVTPAVRVLCNGALIRIRNGIAKNLAMGMRSDPKGTAIAMGGGGVPKSPSFVDLRV